MLLLAFVGLSALAVPPAGGRLSALASLRFRLPGLILLALGTQVLIISMMPGDRGEWREVAHIGTYVLALAFLTANRRVPGAWLIVIGTLSNFAAIAANGGVMPVLPSALAAAGLPVEAGAFGNSLAVEAPRLAFLGDIFAVPSSWPLANVFSVGDLCIGLGAAITLHRICGSRLVPRRSRNLLPLFRHRRFVRLWTAQGISNVGDWIYGLAVATTVVERTGSARALALLLVFQVAPAALFGGLLGPLADRHSRARLMILSDVIRGLAVASLLLSPTPSLIHVYVVATCLGLFGALFQPSLQASIPNVVGEGQVVAATAMVGATFNFAVMAGPAVGGLLVAQFGARPVFVLNAATFVVSALLVAGIQLPRPERREPDSSVRKDLAEGIRYSLATPLVRGLLIVLTVVVMGAASKAPLEPLFVLGTLSLGTGALGLVGASWGLGMLLGSLIAPAMAQRWARERLLAVSIAVVGAAVLTVSRTTELSTIIVAWLAAGTANAVGNVSYESLLQERTPDALRGRVFAASDAAVSAAFLAGAFLAGWAGTHLGIRSAYVISGSLLLFGAVLAWTLLASRRRVSAVSPSAIAPAEEAPASGRPPSPELLAGERLGVALRGEEHEGDLAGPDHAQALPGHPLQVLRVVQPVYPALQAVALGPELAGLALQPLDPAPLCHVGAKRHDGGEDQPHHQQAQHDGASGDPGPGPGRPAGGGGAGPDGGPGAHRALRRRALPPA